MLTVTPEEIFWFWMLAAPSLFVLLMTLFNLAVWPRGRAGERFAGRVSVCIPARNEGRRISGCVTAVLAGDRKPDELLVYDDGSTDGTSEVLERLAETEGCLRVIRGGDLPVGWMGKPHACHHLAEAATGDLLVFLDADVVVTPDFLPRLGWIVEHLRADFVSAMPRQVTGTLSEQMVVPLLDLSYLSWLPLPLVWMSRSPLLRVSNGQVLAVRREALEAAGGWEAVRREVASDSVLCRRVKEAGGRAVYADGHDIASGRMFSSRGHLWNGLSRGLFFRFRGTLGVVLALVLYGALFAPYVGLVQAINGYGLLLIPSAIGVLANHLIRAATTVRLRQNASGLLLHPLGLVWILLILLNSLRINRGNTVYWRGRSYTFGTDEPAA